MVFPGVLTVVDRPRLSVQLLGINMPAFQQQLLDRYALPRALRLPDRLKIGDDSFPLPPPSKMMIAFRTLFLQL